MNIIKLPIENSFRGKFSSTRAMRTKFASMCRWRHPRKPTNLRLFEVSCLALTFYFQSGRKGMQEEEEESEDETTTPRIAKRRSNVCINLKLNFHL